MAVSGVDDVHVTPHERVCGRGEIGRGELAFCVVVVVMAVLRQPGSVKLGFV